MLRRRVFLLRYDPSPTCVELAGEVWEKMHFHTDGILRYYYSYLPLIFTAICARVCSDALASLLLHDVVALAPATRTAAAGALAALVKEYRQVLARLLEQMRKLYEEKNAPPRAIVDDVGREIGRTADQWQARQGVAVALRQLCAFLSDSDEHLLHAYLDLVEPAGVLDRNADVRDAFLAAGVEAVNTYGRVHVDSLSRRFDASLAACQDSAAYDSHRQALVVFLGTLAQHMDDAKVSPIVGKLIETLQTPSQRVQEAVANCLPPLMKSMKSVSCCAASFVRLCLLRLFIRNLGS